MKESPEGAKTQVFLAGYQSLIISKIGCKEVIRIIVIVQKI